MEVVCKLMSVDPLSLADSAVLSQRIGTQCSPRSQSSQRRKAEGMEAEMLILKKKKKKSQRWGEGRQGFIFIGRNAGV